MTLSPGSSTVTPPPLGFPWDEAAPRQALGELLALGTGLRSRGIPQDTLTDFLLACTFCVLADRSGLMPPRIFELLLAALLESPEDFPPCTADLFDHLSHGRISILGAIPAVGGVFRRVRVPALSAAELAHLHRFAQQDGQQVSPALLVQLGGALRGQPAASVEVTRSPLTDPLDGVLASWEAVQAEVQPVLTRVRAQRAANPVVGLFDQPARDAGADDAVRRLQWVQGELTRLRVVLPPERAGDACTVFWRLLMAEWEVLVLLGDLTGKGVQRRSGQVTGTQVQSGDPADAEVLDLVWRLTWARWLRETGQVEPGGRIR